MWNRPSHWDNVCFDDNSTKNSPIRNNKNRKKLSPRAPKKQFNVSSPSKKLGRIFDFKSSYPIGSPAQSASSALNDCPISQCLQVQMFGSMFTPTISNGSMKNQGSSLNRDNSRLGATDAISSARKYHNCRPIRPVSGTPFPINTAGIPPPKNSSENILSILLDESHSTEEVLHRLDDLDGNSKMLLVQRIAFVASDMKSLLSLSPKIANIGSFDDVIEVVVNMVYHKLKPKQCNYQLLYETDPGEVYSTSGSSINHSTWAKSEVGLKYFNFLNEVKSWKVTSNNSNHHQQHHDCLKRDQQVMDKIDDSMLLVKHHFNDCTSSSKRIRAKTSYKTSSAMSSCCNDILLATVYGANKEPVGVLELIGKQKSPNFSSVDRVLLKHLASLISLRSHQIQTDSSTQTDVSAGGVASVGGVGAIPYDENMANTVTALRVNQAIAHFVKPDEVLQNVRLQCNKEFAVDDSITFILDEGMAASTTLWTHLNPCNNINNDYYDNESINNIQSSSCVSSDVNAASSLRVEVARQWEVLQRTLSSMEPQIFRVSTSSEADQKVHYQLLRRMNHHNINPSTIICVAIPLQLDHSNDVSGVTLLYRNIVNDNQKANEVSLAQRMWGLKKIGTFKGFLTEEISFYARVCRVIASTARRTSLFSKAIRKYYEREESLTISLDQSLLISNQYSMIHNCLSSLNVSNYKGKELKTTQHIIEMLTEVLFDNFEMVSGMHIVLRASLVGGDEYKNKNNDELKSRSNRFENTRNDIILWNSTRNEKDENDKNSTKKFTSTSTKNISISDPISIACQSYSQVTGLFSEWFDTNKNTTDTTTNSKNQKKNLKQKSVKNTSAEENSRYNIKSDFNNIKIHSSQCLEHVTTSIHQGQISKNDVNHEKERINDLVSVTTPTNVDLYWNSNKYQSLIKIPLLDSFSTDMDSCCCILGIMIIGTNTKVISPDGDEIMEEGATKEAVRINGNSNNEKQSLLRNSFKLYGDAASMLFSKVQAKLMQSTEANDRIKHEKQQKLNLIRILNNELLKKHSNNEGNKANDVDAISPTTNSATSEEVILEPLSSLASKPTSISTSTYSSSNDSIDITPAVHEIPPITIGKTMIDVSCTLFNFDYISIHYNATPNMTSAAGASVHSWDADLLQQWDSKAGNKDNSLIKPGSFHLEEHHRNNNDVAPAPISDSYNDTSSNTSKSKKKENTRHNNTSNYSNTNPNTNPNTNILDRIIHDEVQSNNKNSILSMKHCVESLNEGRSTQIVIDVIGSKSTQHHSKIKIHVITGTDKIRNKEENTRYQAVICYIPILFHHPSKASSTIPNLSSMVPPVIPKVRGVGQFVRFIPNGKYKIPKNQKVQSHSDGKTPPSLCNTDVKLCESLSALLLQDIAASVWMEKMCALNYRQETLVRANLDMARFLDMYDFLNSITKHVCQQVLAERCTVFIYDQENSCLWSRVASGLSSSQEIRVPISSGLAGAVARTGKLVNVSDVYKDHRFNSSFDKKTGYRSRSCLAVPLWKDHEQQKLRGVIQCMNKLPDYRNQNNSMIFDTSDEKDLLLMGKFIGFSLHKMVSRMEAQRTIITLKKENQKYQELLSDTDLFS